MNTKGISVRSRVVGAGFWVLLCALSALPAHATIMVGEISGTLKSNATNYDVTNTFGLGAFAIGAGAALGGQAVTVSMRIDTDLAPESAGPMGRLAEARGANCQ